MERIVVETPANRTKRSLFAVIGSGCVKPPQFPRERSSMQLDIFIY